MTIGHPDFAEETADRPAEIGEVSRVLTAAGSGTGSIVVDAGKRFRVLAWRLGVTVAFEAAAADFSMAENNVLWQDTDNFIAHDDLKVLVAGVDGSTAQASLTTGWVRVPGPGIVIGDGADLRVFNTIVDRGSTVWQNLRSVASASFLLIQEDV